MQFEWHSGNLWRGLRYRRPFNDFCKCPGSDSMARPKLNDVSGRTHGKNCRNSELRENGDDRRTDGRHDEHGRNRHLSNIVVGGRQFLWIVAGVSVQPPAVRSSVAKDIGTAVNHQKTGICAHICTNETLLTPDQSNCVNSSFNINLIGNIRQQVAFHLGGSGSDFADKRWLELLSNVV